MKQLFTVYAPAAVLLAAVVLLIAGFTLLAFDAPSGVGITTLGAIFAVAASWLISSK